MALKEIAFRNFTGGTNIRDSASELQPDEFSDSINVTLDERGYLKKRLGYADRYGSSLAGSTGKRGFFWSTRGQNVYQFGASVYLENGAAFKTFSTTDRIGMCEFAGNLCMVHPVDGFFIYDGTTLTGPIANAPKGDTLAVWQNKVWSAGDPTNPPRLSRSNAGTAATWTSTDWVDLREKDSAKIRLLEGAGGLDIAGRPGLLAFKEDSSYRINDAATGAYTTIDPSIGCGSNIGGISAYGRTYVLSSRGIYSTDGLATLKEESRLWEPLFSKAVINQSRTDLFCAGRYQDRLHFSLPRAGDVFNSIALEFHPDQGWIVRHSNAASFYVTMSRATTDMVFSSPTLNGMVYNHNVGGADAGNPITSSFTSRWLEPNEGLLTRIRRARFVGLGTFNANILVDYNTGASLAALPVSIIPGASLYDSGALYDAPTSIYGPTQFQSKQDFWSIGTARAVALKIDEVSSATTTGPTVAGSSTAAEQGAWTLAYASLLAIDLGTY
jgi:hypothetical protein